MARNTEATVNVELARALLRRNPRWKGSVSVEQHHVFQEVALRPDIVVQRPRMAPIALETEFAPARTAVADARGRIGKVLKDAGRRVEQAVAIQLPADLREGQEDLAERIESAVFRWRVVSLLPREAIPERQGAESGDAPTPVREWPEKGWLDGGLDELADSIERLELSERVIEESLEILERGVHQATFLLYEDASLYDIDDLERIANVLHQEAGEQTTRMGMAIIANALTFHMSVAKSHRIPAPEALRYGTTKILKYDLLKLWERILEEINYWPIFKIASDVLRQIHGTTAPTVIDRLVGAASRLADIGVTSMHDLCGRMFQRLIADRKYLATFYTLPNSATLLAELAIGRIDLDWASRRKLSRIRIADLACGTGALLFAAYQGILLRHRRTGGDDSKLHRPMMERSLIAADIMPAATHLTASTLSAAHPGMTFRNTRIYTMPYGGPPEGAGRFNAIGSLDLIDAETTRALFGTGELQARGDRADIEVGELNLPHDSIDLVIMNPPFTRPTNHESSTVPVPSFAGFRTSDAEQRAMAKRLKAMGRGGDDLVGHGNAGLASNFVDLAHAKAKPGGIVALVLPAAFMQGTSWRKARELFETRYHDVTVVSIAGTDSTGRAFSADTGMAEVLVTATKNDDLVRNEHRDAGALFVSLLRRPGSLLEAHEIARQIRRIPPEARSGQLQVGGRENAGAYVRSTLQENGSALLLDPEIAETMTALKSGRLRLSRLRKPLRLPIARLGDLGERGLLHRDISGRERDKAGVPRGPFEIVPIRGVSAFPVLWGHTAKRERRLVVKPDRAGEIREGCEDRAQNAWERTATRLHFNLDFRLNSQGLAACLTPGPTIGGRAWPNFRLANEDWDEAMALWANTTLGLMSFWWIGSRQQLGRANLTISSLTGLAVMDPRTLDAEQVGQSNELFRDFQSRTFKPANEAYRCETRQALDRAVLVDLLGLPKSVLAPLDVLRNRWCNEPTVHGGKSTRFGIEEPPASP